MLGTVPSGVDAIAPTCVITSSLSTVTATTPIPVTFTFSENVTGFEVGDITVGNGTAGDFVAVSGSVYTANITPTAAGTVTVDVAAEVCTDAAGNLNTAATQWSILETLASLWLKSTSGLYQDAAGTTPATTGDHPVGLWQDQSGNNYHVSQSTDGKRPLLKLGANGINGLPAVWFDGTDNLLVHTAANFLSSASEGMLFIVFRLDSTIKDGQVLFGSYDTGGTNYELTMYARVNAGVDEMAIYQNNNGGADYVRGSDALTADTDYLAVFASTGTAYVYRLNEVAQTETVVSGGNNGDWFADVINRDNFSVGATQTNTESNFTKGRFAEILLTDYYDADVLASIEAYFHERFFFDVGVVITMDDGYDANYSVAYTYGAAHGVKGTLYLKTSKPDTGDDEWGVGVPTWEQLAEMNAGGWDIGNHTRNHTDLTTLTEAQIITEVQTGEANLNTHGLTRASKHLAYPFGSYNDTVATAIETAGMLTGRRVEGGNLDISTVNRWRIPVIAPVWATSLATLQGHVTTALSQRRFIFFIFHDFTAIEAEYSFPISVWEDFVDWLEAQGFNTYTISEFYTILDAAQ